MGAHPASAALAVALGLAVTARSQTAGQTTSSNREGPLGNDVFLPYSEPAEAALKPGSDAASEAEPTAETLDAWYRAIAESRPSDCVRVARGTRSVDREVLRRLRAAGDGTRHAWRERFGAAAERALALAGSDAGAMRGVERGFPGTREAARAALALADLAYESGDRELAALRLAEAREHAADEDADLARAFDRRSAALGEPIRPRDEGWRSAEGLELVARVPLDARGDAAVDARPGVRPGCCFLGDGRVAVQGADSLHLVDPEGRAASHALPDLVRGYAWSWIQPFAEDDGAWILRPATDGRRIALVVGRAVRTRGNGLLLVDTGTGNSAPEVRWGYTDAGFRGSTAGERGTDELLGSGLWAFEPGPCIVGSTVVVQARHWPGGTDRPSVDEGSVEAWCLAFDLETGLPRWKTRIAVGPAAEVRGWGARGVARPADPLALVATGVFASTGIGAGVLLRPDDGAPMRSVPERRTGEGGRRWRTCAPFEVPGAAPDSAPAILWTPSDSDRMYRLHADPCEDGFARPPSAMGVHRELLGEVGGELLFVARAGGDGDRDSIVRVSPATGARADSIELPIGERFAGGALVSERRVVVASDRSVYLFDLEGGLRLLAAVALPGRRESPDGGIVARGDRVYVAGERSLWILRAR